MRQWVGSSCAVALLLNVSVGLAEKPAVSSTPQPFVPDAKKIALDVAQGFERPPVFKAANVLEASFLQSKDYAVESVVYNDGAMNHFNISSRFGSFYPGSEEMFKKRVHEIGALVTLEKFTDSKVFLDATAKAGGEVLMAPVNGVKTLVQAVADPEETWNVISGVPSGVMRLFHSVGDKISRGVKTGKEAVAGSSEDKKSASDKISDSADVATTYALKHFGYNQSSRVRAWQEYLQIDPYTNNQQLQEKISRIAVIENGVNIGFKFVPGVGGIALVSQANKYYKLAKRVSLYDDPVELAKKAVNQLKAMNVDEDTIKAFTTNPRLSPTSQAFILEALKRLGHIENRTSFVASAARVESFEGALFYVQSARSLAAIDKSEKSLKGFVMNVRLPTVITNKATVVVPIPVDYLTWSKDLEGALLELRSALPKEARNFIFDIRVKGGISSLCKQKLSAANSRVRERFDPPVED